MMILQENVGQAQAEKWVLKEYDFYPERIEERDNQKMIYCQRGAFILKETKAPKQYVDWLAEMMWQLKQKGFSAVLPFYPNKYGDRYVVFAERCYYVLPIIQDQVEEKYKESWELDTLRLLAELHQKTVSSSTNRCPLKPLSLSRLEKRWRKRLEQLADYRELAVKKRMMSPFELAFVDKFDYLHQLGERAIYYLQEWQRKYGGSKLRYVLCHGHVGRKTVLHTKEGRFLINFDRANMDSPARDLALYYRKNVNLGEEYGLEHALHYLASYEDLFTLTSAEKLLFAIFLLFPEQVIKEIERYYGQATDWTEVKQTAFLEKQIKGTLTIRQFIKNILA